MVSLALIYNRLFTYPHLLDDISLAGLIQFIQYLQRLRRDVALLLPSAHDLGVPPFFLPEVIQAFLAESLGTTEQNIHSCWLLLKDVVWDDSRGEHLDIAPEPVFR